MTAAEVEGEEVEEQGWGDDVDIVIDDGESASASTTAEYLHIYITCTYTSTLRNCMGTVRCGQIT